MRLTSGEFRRSYMLGGDVVRLGQAMPSDQHKPHDPAILIWVPVGETPTTHAFAASGTVLHGSGSRAPRPLPRPGSGDADGLRASQLQHAVERVDADVDLGGPAPVGARVQPIPDHAFVA